jgi:rubrerythrin
MKAAEIARSMETDAVAFYKECAKKVSHPAGRRMFESIMEDEKRHIIMIDNLLKGMNIRDETTDPLSRVRSVFEEMKDEMQARVTASSEDAEALALAMKMEKAGYDFYVKTASEATDAKVKALFTRLLGEEEKHYQMFSNTHEFLTHTRHWMMYEERGIVEG